MTAATSPPTSVRDVLARDPHERLAPLVEASKALPAAAFNSRRGGLPNKVPDTTCRLADHRR